MNIKNTIKFLASVFTAKSLSWHTVMQTYGVADREVRDALPNVLIGRIEQEILKNITLEEYQALNKLIEAGVKGATNLKYVRDMVIRDGARETAWFFNCLHDEVKAQVPESLAKRIAA